jgi:dienelactone hydrolase
MELQEIVSSEGDRRFTGYLADGSRGRRAPGVLVAHEGGLTAHTKGRTLMLAELGHVAFAMDIFGEANPTLERARALVQSLRADPATLRRRAAAALSLLRSHPHVDPGRLAAIGFCFGGLTVLELARSGADLACVVGFHAGLTTSTPEDARAIRGKILVCMGADDPVITAEHRAAFAAEMSAAHVDWQMHVHGGVGHSFTNRHIDEWKIPGFAYHAAADQRSWRAMRDLFDEVFGAPGAKA